MSLLLVCVGTPLYQLQTWQKAGQKVETWPRYPVTPPISSHESGVTCMEASAKGLTHRLFSHPWGSEERSVLSGLVNGTVLGMDR